MTHTRSALGKLMLTADDILRDNKQESITCSLQLAISIATDSSVQQATRAVGII
jgi:hypothetical protein